MRLGEQKKRTLVENAMADDEPDRAMMTDKNKASTQSIDSVALDETVVQTDDHSEEAYYAVSPYLRTVDPTLLHQPLDAAWSSPFLMHEFDGYTYGGEEPYGPTHNPYDAPMMIPANVAHQSFADVSAQQPGREFLTSTTERFASLSVSEAHVVAPQYSARPSTQAPMYLGDGTQVPHFSHTPNEASLSGQAPTGRSMEGWIYVPDGFYPLLVPSHISFTSEIVNNLTALGAVVPNAPPSNAKKQKKTVRRPANSFMLYRREKQEEVLKANKGMRNSEASVVIGEMWKNEDQEVREHYRRKYEEAKRAHDIKHPDYKFERSSSSTSKGAGKRKSGTDAAEEASSGPSSAHSSQENIGEAHSQLPNMPPGLAAAHVHQPYSPAYSNWQGLYPTYPAAAHVHQPYSPACSNWQGPYPMYPAAPQQYLNTVDPHFVHPSFSLWQPPYQVPLNHSTSEPRLLFQRPNSAPTVSRSTAVPDWGPSSAPLLDQPPTISAPWQGS